MQPTCDCSFFNFSHGVVRICEIELSHTGQVKTTEIPIRCARNIILIANVFSSFKIHVV